MRITNAEIIIFVGLLFLAANLSFAADPPEKPYEQEYFLVGFWGDPPVDNLVRSRYADVATANFNVVMGGVGADTPEKAKIQRDTCEKYGLKVLFSTYGLPVDQLCNCTTTYGFLIRDHPAVADFPEVLARVKDFRRERASKLSFINLFPNTASAADMGADTYTDYVEQFIAAIHPQVLCFDHYPAFLPEADGRDAYCDNLQMIRSYAIRENIPFWCFIKAMAFGSDVVPTEAQIRWQVYAALTYGVKGILYSCYYLPEDENEFRGSGIIDASCKPTERYGQVAKLNAELNCLGPVLFESESRKVWRVVPGREILSDIPVTITAQSDGATFLVGAFQTKKGKQLITIMNYADQGTDVQAEIAFAASIGKVMEISKDTGKSVAIPTENNSANLEFAPGDGRVFLVED